MLRSSCRVANTSKLWCGGGAARSVGSLVIIPGDEDSYENLKNADGKKIMYFTATWCPPCKRIAPVFEALSKKNPGISFIKVDVDDLSSAAAAAGIQSVPTFQFRSGPEKKFEFSGADEDMLKMHIQKLEVSE